ncbi:MAG TPA: hypothetical protein VF618_17310 [Thermoanaerobaculia bacterium]
MKRKKKDVPDNVRPMPPTRPDLTERTTIEIDIPRWLLGVLEYRVAETNEDATDEERVDLHHVIEWHLVSPITIREVPLLEAKLPGTAEAIARWLEGRG